MFHKVFNSSNNKASLDQQLEESIFFNLSDDNLSQDDLTGENIAKTEKAEQAIWQGIRAEKQKNYKLAISYYRLAVEEDSESAKAYQLLSNVLKKAREERQYNSGVKEGEKIEFESPSDVAALPKEKKPEEKNEEGLVYINSSVEDRTLDNAIVENSEANSTLLPDLGLEPLANPNFSNVNLVPVSTTANETNLATSHQESSKIVLLPEVSTSPSGEFVLQDNTAAAQVYVEQALVYCEQKQWKNSIAACKEAIRICPSIGEAYKIWGNCLQKSGDVAGAIGIYAKALEVKPDMAEIYCNLGSIYAKKKSWQQAIEHYQKSSIIEPKNSTPYRNLARVWDELGEYEKSTECFFKALELDPTILSAQNHFELANNLFEENELDKAIACYEYCIQVEPKFINAYIKLADVLEKDGKTEAALSYYKRLAQLQTPPQNPKSQSKSSLQIRSFLYPGTKKSQLPPAKPKRRVLHLGANRAAKSVPRLQPAKGATSSEEIALGIKAVKQQPQSAQAIAFLGRIYFKHQQWQNAISCYSQAIKLAPKKAEYYINLGKVWEKAGNLVNANQAFYHGFTIEPKQVSAKNHYVLGNKLLEQGKVEQAISCHRRAITLKPDLLEAYWQLGEILKSQKNYQGACACYQQAIKIKPEQAQSYLLLGKVLTDTQQWQPALRCYAKAAELKPNNADIQHNLGEALTKAKKWQGAAKAYQKAIAIDPKNSWSYNNLGDVLLKLERWSEAAQCYKKAIALKPDFIWSHQNLGEALSKLEKWEQAIACYRQVLQLDKNLPWTLLNLGDALSKIFRWQDAIKCYKQAVHLKPDFSLAYARLGDALVREEKWEDAIGHYEHAIEIDPGIDVSVYRNLKEALDRKKFLEQVKLAESGLIITDAENWPHTPVQIYEPPLTLPDGNPWPKISIVTPSYNQGKFIEETVLSVIHQNYPNVEYILIDGESDDETLEVIKKYHQHFSYVVSEPDSGQSNAINKGFAHATGEIFTWLNSDDLLAPGALYAIALAFYTSKADAVAGVCQIFQDGKEVEQHLTSCNSGTIPLADILDLENCWLKGKFFYQPEVMFTRAIWEKAGGMVNESLYYSMDYEMWARFAAQGAKLEVIGFPIAQYRMHPEQKTSTMDKYQPELLKVRQSLEKQYKIAPRNSELVISKRRSLKVAVLNDTGSLGGAGIAHQRIAQALSLAGHQVISVAGTLDWSLTPVDCTVEQVEEIIASIEPDLLVIGNIHNFQRPLDILERLTAQYPTVFVMHDQWLLTGRCGYTSGCENYTILCDAECPTWDEYPRLAPGKIAQAFSRKQELLRNNDNLLILSDSQWLREWSRCAYLNRVTQENYDNIERKFQHLYYGVDLKVFRPQDKIESRLQLDLPQDKFIILTGSQSLEDERKGFKYLLQALEIANLENVLVLCFGHEFELSTELEIKSVGYISSSTLLSYYYSAADLFVSPALEEAFGQTFIEAAACGTPAVGFGVGGVTEAVSNEVSGCIVSPKTPEALAGTIKELYCDRSKLELLGRLAPFYVANNFSLAASYHSIINAWENSGWLSNLGMSAVTKFTVDELPRSKFLTVKGGNPNKDSPAFYNKLPVKIAMDRHLQGSGWYPAENVNGVSARWMKRLGSVIIEPIDTSRALYLELLGIGTVDPQLLQTITVKINGNQIDTKVDERDNSSWSCLGNISPSLLVSGVAFLITIEVKFVRQLSFEDPRKGSLLVESLTLKSQD